MTTREAFIAVTRFGLGARPGELARAAPNPRGWLLDQIVATPRTPPALGQFRSGSQAMAQYQRIRVQRGDPGVERLLREIGRAHV